VAGITASSPIQMVTVRPGVLPRRRPRVRTATVSTLGATPRGRVRRLDARRDDDVEALVRAETVVGVGTGVPPERYGELDDLRRLLRAELGATRKVTDRGWLPRCRQIGITGRTITPRLYVGLAVSGKFNHMVGVRSAGTVLVVNRDPDAPVFDACDVGIVGDWADIVPRLARALDRAGVATR
jgi:electron transfer flavoprotein alpha subunit